MKKEAKDIKLIINGGGAAGASIAEMLNGIGIKNIIICDTKGAIYEGRKEHMNESKEYLAKISNPGKV